MPMNDWLRVFQPRTRERRDWRKGLEVENDGAELRVVADNGRRRHKVSSTHGAGCVCRNCQ